VPRGKLGMERICECGWHMGERERTEYGWHMGEREKTECGGHVEGGLKEKTRE